MERLRALQNVVHRMKQVEQTQGDGFHLPRSVIAHQVIDLVQRASMVTAFSPVGHLQVLAGMNVDGHKFQHLAEQGASIGDDALPMPTR